MQQFKQIIKSLVPTKVLQFYHSFKYPQTSSESGYWIGDYATWDEALKQTSGYDELSILHKIKDSTLKVKRGEAQYERDSIAFNDFEYSTEFLNALKYVVKDNKVSIIDFGGSLGSQYFQYKRFFDGIDMNWMVVEQAHFVDCGKKDIADDQLHFFYTIEEALKYKEANTVVLSSVLPYIKDPFELIQKIVSYEFDYIIIDRNPFIDMNRDLITIQIVPQFVYKASYPSWFFYEEKFLEAFKYKYTILKEFDSPFAAPMLVNNVQACWKGFILKKI
jgi:putative methyltransferase (TIGR04325 family)